MNRKKTSMAFMMEYLLMILIFIGFFAVNTQFITKAYRASNLANHKRMALEYATNTLEKGDTDFRERRVNEQFEEDEDGIYLVRINDVTKDMEYQEIEVIYEDVSLLKLPFVKKGDSVNE